MNIRRHVDQLNDRLFDAFYARALVYNTCWEDPAIDRQVLDLGPGDDVMVIASAGCNALDYVLTGPASVHAVDMNPRQIALLELKLAAIRALDFDDFFAIFGHGRHPRFEILYAGLLREQLSPFARTYWDRHQRVFGGADNALEGLYFHGLSGKVARAFHLYLRCRPRLRDGIDALLATSALDEQRAIYDTRIAPALWRRDLNWMLSRQFTMSMLGVPQPQRREVENQHAGGVAAFIRDAIEHVFRRIPLAVNYFWRVYLSGHYTRECCPEYLREENFHKLRDGLADRIRLHTCSVTSFLRAAEHDLSRFVLLDHMDWMSSAQPAALAEEWQALFARARNGARVIFRSAHAWPAYLDAVRVDGGRSRAVERLRFHPELAAALAPHDRVHTYAGFHIADVLA
ncbi:MAG: BtaA family protein [Gammaproteobacteria bacterium]